MRPGRLTARWAVAPMMIGLLPGIAHALSKTITVNPNVAVNAVTTWFYANCTTSAGIGSYTVIVTPMHGTVNFGELSAPLPGCLTGSPPLPAEAAYYTWTDTTTAPPASDFFELLYEAPNGETEVDDITVELPACAITSETLATVPGQANSRTRVGVGEWVKLTTNISVTWGIDSGGGTLTEVVRGKNGQNKCSTAISGSPIITGTQACFTAPYSNSSTIVTATATSQGGSSCSIPFATVQPTGLIFQRLTAPGYSVKAAPNNHYFIRMISVAFLTPGDVSFTNIGISEEDKPNPSLIPNYIPPLLVTIYNTKAWLVGCDHDLDHNDGQPSLSKQSYWVYVDPDDNETRFSLVKTETSHTGLFGDYYYSKGQIEALSADGTFVPTPGVPAAILDVPWYVISPGVNMPNRQTCEIDVEGQFPGSVLGSPSQ